MRRRPDLGWVLRIESRHVVRSVRLTESGKWWNFRLISATGLLSHLLSRRPLQGDKRQPRDSLMARQSLLPRNIGVVALRLEQCQGGGHPGNYKNPWFCVREHVLHDLLW